MSSLAPQLGTASCGCRWCNEHENAREKCRQVMTPLVRQALTEVGTRPDVGNLAEQCFVSPAHFRRLIAQVFDVGYTATVWRYRVFSAYYSLLFGGSSFRDAARTYGFRGPRDLMCRAQRALNLPRVWLEHPATGANSACSGYLTKRERANWVVTSHFEPLADMTETAWYTAHLPERLLFHDLVCFIYDNPTNNESIRFDIATALAKCAFPDSSLLGVLVTPPEKGVSIIHRGPIEFTDMAYREIAIIGAYMGVLRIGSPPNLPLRVEFVNESQRNPRAFLPIELIHDDRGASEKRYE